MGEVYNEEFQQYMHLARYLVRNLHDSRGLQASEERNLSIYRKWIKKIRSLESEDPIVKKNRNAFFKYMLHVLQDGRLEGPFSELELDFDKANLPSDCPCIKRPEKKPEEKTIYEVPCMCYWSPDATTYVSIQPLQGCGALIYMAISYNTQLGWEIP